MAKVTFDGVNRLIIVDPGITELDVKIDIYSDWKEWMLLADNAKYPLALRVVGGDPVSESKNLGSTYFLLNGWRIRPQEAEHRLIIQGNLYTDPAGSSPVIRTLGNYSVIVEYSVSNIVDSSIQSLPTLEFSSYNNGVTIKPSSPYSGTTFPVGTLQQPVNNLTDALAIANERGLSKFFVLEDITIATGDYSGKIFEAPVIGTGITIQAGANVSACRFENATISGQLDGDAHIHKCIIQTATTYQGGFIEECALIGELVLEGSDPVYLVRCVDADPGSDVPSLNLTNFTGSLSVREYFGGLSIKNKTTSDTVAIDLVTGRLIVEPTVTAGTIRVRGIGTLQNNSTGTAVVDSESLISVTSVSAAVWDRLLTSMSVAGSAGARLKKVLTTGQFVALR